MRGLVIVLVILVIIASASFVVLSINNSANEKVEITDGVRIRDGPAFAFSAFTSAVCEDKEDSVYCKDEVFVNCNGEISKAEDVIECNGLKIDAPKVTGFAVFGKDWKDPRNQ